MAEVLDGFEFPRFIEELPEADIPYEGLRGYALQGDRGLVVFSEADTEVNVVEHSHGDQWGIVLEGRVDYIVAGRTQHYYAGDTYFIPAGVPHGVKFYPGARSVDIFSDRDRYPIKRREHSRRP